MASQVQFPKKEEEELPVFTPAELDSPKDKLWRKLKKEPLVPIGCLLTCGALIVASNHLRKGNRDAFNRSLRWRIYFQGLTVVAAAGGAWYYGLGSPAPATPVDPSSSSPSSASGSSSSIATVPGRPATNFQVAKDEGRQIKTRQEWQERFNEAKRKEEAEEKEAQQKRLEAALLRGTGMEKDVEATAAEAEPQAEAPPTRPVIGKDRRERRAD